jgi:hypothetical protein
VLRGWLPLLSHTVKMWTRKRWAPLTLDAQKKWRSSFRRRKSMHPILCPWFFLRIRLRLLHLHRVCLLLRIPLLLRWRRLLFVFLDDWLLFRWCVVDTRKLVGKPQEKVMMSIAVSFPQLWNQDLSNQ